MKIQKSINIENVIDSQMSFDFSSLCLIGVRGGGERDKIPASSPLGFEMRQLPQPQDLFERSNIDTRFPRTAISSRFLTCLKQVGVKWQLKGQNVFSCLRVLGKYVIMIYSWCHFYNNMKSPNWFIPKLQFSQESIKMIQGLNNKSEVAFWMDSIHCAFYPFKQLHGSVSTRIQYFWK